MYFDSIATVTQPGQMNGVLKTNQDSFCNFSINFGDKKEDWASVVAVFDGHGSDGHNVSKFLS